MPVQSSIIVTRSQMRLSALAGPAIKSPMIRAIYCIISASCPTNAFFWNAGGLFATDEAQSAISKEIRQNFSTLFPKWREVEIEYEWSGLACLSRSQTPMSARYLRWKGPLQVYLPWQWRRDGKLLWRSFERFSARKTTPNPLPCNHANGFTTLSVWRYRRHLMRPLYAYMAWSDK